MILVFRDVSWVMERTNVWDAIGVGSYGMVFAFAETVVLFVVFTFLGFFLIPKQWDVGKRVALLSLLVIILSAWGVISQLLFLWNVSPPRSALQFLAQSEHPVRIIYAVSFAIVLPSIGVPVYLFLRSDKLFRSIQGLSEQLSLLTMFYLFFDLAGLVVVIIRNIP